MAIVELNNDCGNQLADLRVVLEAQSPMRRDWHFDTLDETWKVS